MGLVFRAECCTTPALSFSTVIFGSPVSEHFVSYLLIIFHAGQAEGLFPRDSFANRCGHAHRHPLTPSRSQVRGIASIGNKIGEPTPPGIPYLAHPLLFS